MAADISVVNGLAEAMYANNPAWHRLGTVVYQGTKHAPNSEEAITAAHLGWIVEKKKIFLADGTLVPHQWATVRADTNTPLGIVGDRYSIQQNTESFDFLDSMMQDGIMRYESAMALDGGRKVALLARMPEVDVIAEGDSSLRYILFSTTHDGTGSINVLPTSVRVVCANTLRMAMSEGKGSGNVMSIRHTASKGDRLKKAAKWISQFSDKFTLYADNARHLAEVKFDKVECQQYLNELFPTNEEMTSRQLENIKKRIEIVRNSFLDESNMLPSIKGTWWHLFNAITHSVDHSTKYRVRGYTDDKQKMRLLRENRFENLLEGAGADFKDKAFALALSMAG